MLNLADDVLEVEICSIHDDIIRNYCPDMIEKCFSYSYVDEAKEDNIPKCPICNSTNISRISATTKVVNTAVFVIFGHKRKHQLNAITANMSGSFYHILPGKLFLNFLIKMII